MPKELVISAAPHETRVAILEDGLLCEIYIEREKEFALVGSIYKGRVTRVLPGMQSAFVDIGLDSDAFLYVGDFLENLDDFDHVITAVEGKVEKMEQQGGVIFPPGQAAEVSAADAASPENADAGGYPTGDTLHASDVSEHQPYSEGAAGLENESPSDNIGNRSFEPGQHAPQTRPAQNVPQRPSAPPAGQPFNQDRGGRRPDQGQGYRQGQGAQGRNQGDRGNRQRGGRFRRGRGGDRQQGRDLPPSKYAAPRPYVPPSSRPYEPPTEELPSDFTPIILPGESLAKYKDRVPSASPASGSEPHAAPATPSGHSESTRPESADRPHSESTATSGQTSYPPVADAHTPDSADAPAAIPTPILPPSLYAESEPATSPAAPETHDTYASPDPFAGSRHEHHDAPGALGSGPELTDEEVTELAEQLAEARQEEATAKAEAATLLPHLDQSEENAEDDADEDAADHDLGPHVDVDDVAGAALAAKIEASEAALESELEDDDADDDATDADSHPDAAHDPHEPESSFASSSDSQSESQSDSPTGSQSQVGSSGPDADTGAEPALDHPESGTAPDKSAAPAPSSQQQRPMSARVSDQQRARFQRPMRRGGRPQRGGGNRQGRPHDNRQPVRRPQLISEMLKTGQEIIVQIAKEPLGKKGARITSHVALPGRFLVYMPTVNHIGVSRRINSAEERSRLRRVVTEAKATFPGGFIVRTAAEGAPEDEIRSDVEFLGRTWDKIRNQAEPRKSPALLHRDLNLVERILRDYVSNDYTAIWIDNEEEFSKVVDFVSRFQPKLVSRVKLYTKPAPIFEEFGIQQELDKALRPKVWLKSGGYIVINHTEALVAIDVNTGKYVGRGSTRLEDTIVKTNLEAVKEIVRQIRLRDLGGIIVLDFIDMEERRNRDKVMAALDSALRADRAPSKALPFNEFGLVAVTRKRTKQALERVLCQPCPYCTGSGMVKSVPTICYEIQAEARKMAVDLDATSLTLRVHPEIAKALKTREAALIEELEQNTRKSIIIQADPTLHWEQYDIY